MTQTDFVFTEELLQGLEKRPERPHMLTIEPAVIISGQALIQPNDYSYAIR